MIDSPTRILPSSIEDIPLVMSFFDRAIDYQRLHGYNLWPRFTADMIHQEMGEGRHWKITSGKDVLGFFSVL